MSVEKYSLGRVSTMKAVSAVTLIATRIALTRALSVVPIENVTALNVGAFAGDTTRPTLTTYELDKDAGLLTLNFSEVIDYASFNLTAVTLQTSAVAALDRVEIESLVAIRSNPRRCGAAAHADAVGRAADLGHEHAPLGLIFEAVSFI